jgi:hypothetical protein
MSEHAKPTHESGNKLMNVDTSERAQQLHAEQQAKGPEAHQHKEKIGEIRSTVENAAIASESAAKASESSSANTGGSQHHWWSPEFKITSYKQTLGRVRKHLSPAEKTLSKIVHQPLVEQASEIGSKTIARPSGILVGSVLSFGLSTTAYILTKRYGYDLPNSIFGLCFVGGFMIGIIGEFVYKTLHRLSQNS